MKEGFTIEDFKTVIDKKAAEWQGTDFEQYLWPTTLFGTKFEGYLNAKAIKATKATKAPAKKAAAKTTAKKEAVKSQYIVQYQNNEVEFEKIEERVKAQFVSEGHKAGTIKKINVYVKPEEYSAYYVINDKFSGRVDLF